LRLALHFHRESIILTDYRDDAIVQTRLVAAMDVARTLAQELDLATGVLPGDSSGTNTLWWAKTGGGLQIALYVPPAIRAIRVGGGYSGDPAQQLTLPWPPLVFLYLQGRHPYVFACRERPREQESELYYAPAYNVFDSGRICVGSHQFPDRAEAVPGAFFESNFSRAGDTQAGKSKKNPHNIGLLWEELHGQDVYPLDDLVPQLRVSQAMRIGA
jgi:PRTRC genetic system protein B